MAKTAFIYSDELWRVGHGEGHPLKPVREKHTYELLEAYGVFAHEDAWLVEPKEATVDDLLLIHTEEYVEAVRKLSRGEGGVNPAAYNFGPGDNPVFAGMYDISLLHVGASLLAADLMADGRSEVAFSISGGRHHAGPDYASGFCIFNDPAIAIAHLMEQGLRVAYVDIDAHHGDGVQKAFYRTDQVLTISLHESGQSLFPGTGWVHEMGQGKGRGYSVNLPLAPYTDDETYLWAFNQIVPPLVEAFQPDIVVSQLGIDTHYLDPLTHLSLTTEGYVEVVKVIKGLAPRWVALGGGGYELKVVPRAWSLAYGIMLGLELPDEIPSDYKERYGLQRLRDHEKPDLDAGIKERARRYAEREVEEIKRTIFPLHGR